MRSSNSIAYPVKCFSFSIAAVFSPQFPDVLALEDDLPHIRSAAKVE